jgi:hypothetical protein
MPVMHIPVNHPLRPLYRTLSGLAGLYVLAVGLIGFGKANGLGLFAQQDLPTVLGLQVNLAFALLAIVTGALLLAGAIVGRNLDHYINLTVCGIYLIVGTAMLTLMRTDANIFGFAMSNVVVLYLIGMLNMAAGLYGKVGSVEAAKAEHDFRHNGTVGGY